MGTSSGRVGPAYDTLRVVVQPHSDRTTYGVTRLHFDGPRRTDIRVASGNLKISAADLSRLDAVGLLERVLDAMRTAAQPSPPPLGDMGEQLTLDLASRG